MSESHAAEAQDGDEHEEHQLPVGALIITLSYLLLLTMLWVQVYLQMLNSGGIPR
jgi:hypothetical protein